MRAPMAGCCSMCANSSSVSVPGLRSTASRHADLADVVQQRAQAEHVELALGEASSRPMMTESAATRSEWPAV